MQPDLMEMLKEMKPNQKINYDKLLQKMIETWQSENFRPLILLHSCCAPCSTYTLEYLTKHAEVVIYFANANIHPRAEFERRKLVQETFIRDFNEKTGQKVGFISEKYEPQKFLCAVKGLEDEPEGGLRCSACFNMRLDQAANKAREIGADYFGSALTISPHKNSELINHIGLEVQALYDMHYLPSDFKKKGGYRRSVEMCQEYDIYRQCYCGCVFSAKQQGIDLKKVNQEAQAHLAERLAGVKEE
nr:epoxyqueuosine reductase QueH [Listeria costaricensis]